MDLKDAIMILIAAIQEYAFCGRLKDRELEAVHYLKKYIKDNKS